MSSGDDIGERLREAACVGDLTLVAKLEIQGVDLNSKNSMNGWTALHWACKRNHIAVVKYLLERGADKNSKNNDGHVPAQLTSNEEIHQILGASPECEVKNVPLPIVPNYIASPAFPYLKKDRDNETYASFPQSNNTHHTAAGDSRTAHQSVFNNGIADGK
uniref:Uncharacterized protein n=1 Tax=Arion vulgaris TaxID=1028688 RepID=A0A0B6ZH85_9EUPU